MILAGAIEIPLWLILVWLALVIVVFTVPYMVAAALWWPVARRRWPSAQPFPTWFVALLTPAVAGMVSLRLTDAAGVLWLAACLATVVGIVVRLVERARRRGLAVPPDGSAI